MRGYAIGLFVAAVFLQCDYAWAQNKAACPATDERTNLALARAWHDDVINQRKPEALAGILSDKLVHHASGGYPATMNSAGVAAMMDDFLKAFPDLRYTFDLLEARGEYVIERYTGEYVIERYTATGTQRGRLGDLPASGRKATWTGINIFRIECSRIAEVWSEVDAAGRTKQLTAR
jgi:predicted ester cyclase